MTTTVIALWHLDTKGDAWIGCENRERLQQLHLGLQMAKDYCDALVGSELSASLPLLFVAPEYFFTMKGWGSHYDSKSPNNPWGEPRRHVPGAIPSQEKQELNTVVDSLSRQFKNWVIVPGTTLWEHPARATDHCTIEETLEREEGMREAHASEIKSTYRTRLRAIRTSPRKDFTAEIRSKKVKELEERLEKQLKKSRQYFAGKGPFTSNLGPGERERLLLKNDYSTFVHNSAFIFQNGLMHTYEKILDAGENVGDRKAIFMPGCPSRAQFELCSRAFRIAICYDGSLYTDQMRLAVADFVIYLSAHHNNVPRLTNSTKPMGVYIHASSKESYCCVSQSTGSTSFFGPNTKHQELEHKEELSLAGGKLRFFHVVTPGAPAEN